MKKLKIVAIISGILTFLNLFPIITLIVALAKYKLAYGFPQASAIGIIGGADGPTAIYVVDAVTMLPVIVRYAFLAICTLTFIISIILLVKYRDNNNK